MTYTLEELNKMVADLEPGGSLDLSSLTSIPEGFNPTVGGWLYLSSLTSIPEGFNPTVGGSLDLNSLTSIPEGFNPTVGGSLYLSSLTSKEKKKAKITKLCDGMYVPGKYMFCDGILTHVAKVKKVGQYTLYVGKIPNRHVVTDGKHYAHCKTLRQGISDLAFKNMKDRGADQYKNVALDTEMTVEEMVTMYRIITGACSQGSESFVASLGELKERYTVAEAIELTKGQYNAERFAEFFDR